MGKVRPVTGSAPLELINNVAVAEYVFGNKKLTTVATSTVTANTQIAMSLRAIKIDSNCEKLMCNRFLFD